MIIEKYTMTTIQEMETLDTTVRGEGGFGSTGVSSSAKKSLAELEAAKQKWVKLAHLQNFEKAQ